MAGCRRPQPVCSLESVTDQSDGHRATAVAGPSATTAESKLPSAGHKKWAGRRRPRPVTSSSTAIADTASKIATMADCERQYFAAKLEMDKAEHAVKMRVLQLQEEFEIKRLKKLEE